MLYVCVFRRWMAFVQEIQRPKEVRSLETEGVLAREFLQPGEWRLQIIQHLLQHSPIPTSTVDFLKRAHNLEAREWNLHVALFYFLVKGLQLLVLLVSKDRFPTVFQTVRLLIALSSHFINAWSAWGWGLGIRMETHTERVKKQIICETKKKETSFTTFGITNVVGTVRYHA